MKQLCSVLGSFSEATRGNTSPSTMKLEALSRRVFLGCVTFCILHQNTFIISEISAGCMFAGLSHSFDLSALSLFISFMFNVQCSAALSQFDGLIISIRKHGKSLAVNGTQWIIEDLSGWQWFALALGWRKEERSKNSSRKWTFFFFFRERHLECFWNWMKNKWTSNHYT